MHAEASGLNVGLRFYDQPIGSFSCDSAAIAERSTSLMVIIDPNLAFGTVIVRNQGVGTLGIDRRTFADSAPTVALLVWLRNQFTTKTARIPLGEYRKMQTGWL